MTLLALPCCATLVTVLVIHGVLTGVVQAVLAQHLGEHYVPLIPAQKSSFIFYNLLLNIPEDTVISIAYNKEPQEGV